MSGWIYFGAMIAFIIVFFIVFKRPMYEVMFVCFIVLAVCTGNIGKIGHYWVETSKSYLPFTLTGFVVFAVVFEKTGIINDLINIIVALVGRFHGGAGYVALAATAAMGSFCGTGPGTAAACGTVTIPSMKRTGYSPELAAVVSAAGSTMGPTIPPSAAIPIMFEMLDVCCPGRYTGAQFWMFAWPICLWLVLQRFITLYFVVRKQNVQPIPKEERLSLSKALKDGWPSLTLIVALFLPFLFTMLYEDGLILNRLGAAGAAHSSGFTLCVVPTFATLVTLFIYKKKGNLTNINEILKFVGDAAASVGPVIVITFSGYCINTMLQDMGVTQQLVAGMTSLNPARWIVLIGGPLFFTILGMFIETSTLYLVFGPVFIPLAIAVGVNPMIAAMSVNIMTNTMGQLTPPFALCLLVSMGIAEADFKKTCKLSIPWVLAQFAVIVLYLYGLLPMFGMAV